MKTINLEQKDKSGDFMHPDFHPFSEAVVIRIVWYWHKNRNIDQWNRMESPKINPCICG